MISAFGRPDLEPVFRAAQGRFQDILSQIGALEPVFAAYGGPPPAPRFDQDWFPPLDMMAAVAILSLYRPGRLVEIGGGHSTRVFHRAAVDAEFGLSITTIDPGEKAARKLQGLAVEHIRDFVPACGEAPFLTLGSGDVLSLDGSHRDGSGGDVDFVFRSLWPRLPQGVLVHVHDVFLPDPYPPVFAARAYDEQGVVGDLIAGGEAQILFSSAYAMRAMTDAVMRGPVAVRAALSKAPPASLWLIKRASSVAKI